MCIRDRDYLLLSVRLNDPCPIEAYYMTCSVLRAKQPVLALYIVSASYVVYSSFYSEYVLMASIILKLFGPVWTVTVYAGKLVIVIVSVIIDYY